MTTTIQAIRSLKVGRYIVVDDAPCRIVEYITSKPGKHGEAKARIVAVGIFDGTKRSLVHPVKHKVHVPQVDNRKGQVLNRQRSEVQFMDLETWETFTIPMGDIPTEFQGSLEPGGEIRFLQAMGRRLVTRA